MVYKLKFQEEAKEQFTALAKMAKGAAASKIIKDAISSDSLFQFSELAISPNLLALKQDEKYSKDYEILKAFMSKTLLEYKASGEFPELNSAELKKLRQLTLLTLAGRSKAIPYSELYKELEFKELGELEDFIIHNISLGIIFGKMDQMNKKLLIIRALDRDTTAENLLDIINCFTELQEKCHEARSILKLERNRIVIKARSIRDTREAYTESILKIKKAIPDSKRMLKDAGDDLDILDHGLKSSLNKKRFSRN